MLFYITLDSRIKIEKKNWGAITHKSQKCNIQKIRSFKRWRRHTSYFSTFIFKGAPLKLWEKFAVFCFSWRETSSFSPSQKIWRKTWPGLSRIPREIKSITYFGNKRYSPFKGEKIISTWIIVLLNILIAVCWVIQCKHMS